MIDLGELLCFGPCFLSRHIPHYQCPYPYIISKSVIVLYVLPEDPFLTLSVLDLCGMGFSGPCQQTFHCIHAKSLQSYLTLFNSMDCSLPGSSIHEILQARILEWVAISCSRESSWPRNRSPVSCVSYIAGRFFIIWATGEAWTPTTNQSTIICNMG